MDRVKTARQWAKKGGRQAQDDLEDPVFSYMVTQHAPQLALQRGTEESAGPPPIQTTTQTRHPLHPPVRKAKRRTKIKKSKAVQLPQRVALSVRRRIRTGFGSALGANAHATQVATALEAVLFDKLGKQPQAYRRKSVDLLHDLRHTSLSSRLLDGSLTAACAVELGPNETAKELAAERLAARREGLQARIISLPSMRKTDEFQCGDCQSTACTFRVLNQPVGFDSRKTSIWGSVSSVEEQILVKCDNCGHSWTKQREVT